MREKHLLYLFMLLSLLLVWAACAAPPQSLAPTSSVAEKPTSTPTPSPTPSPTPTSTPTPIPTPTMPSPTLSPEMQEVADQATQIISKLLNISPDSIIIHEVQRVQWRDTSLGCPQPGMMYAQVITPGYLVRAESNGKTLEVHMNDRGHGIICPPDRAKSPL